MKNLFKDKNMIYKVPLIASLAAVLVCVPLRVYQYFKLINPVTGFYDSKDFSVYVVYGVLILAGVICVACSYIGHKSLKAVAIGQSDKGFSVVSVLMGFGIAVDSFSILSDYLALYTANTGNYLAVSDYVSAQGGTLMLAQAVTGALAAIYFIISALSSINKNLMSKIKILCILPVIWCIFRLLFRFRRTISFVNVSDLLLELFNIVFVMVFLLALAQVIAKIDADNVFWKLYAYGLPAAMLSIVCFLPRLILVLTGNADKLNPLYSPAFSDLTFAVYAIYICITSVKTKTTSVEE